MLIDPRQFILGPFRACPKCGRNAFGALDVGGLHVSRRCRECSYAQSERLVPLQKRVVYLDQMILSNIAKSLDPEWGTQHPPREDYWTRAFDALDRAVKLQLVVCPYSRIHESESVVTPFFPALKRLYEHLAIGIEYEWPTTVHRAQLTHAFRRVLRGEEAGYGLIARDQVIRGDLSAWAERIGISVHWPIADPKPEEVRRARRRSGEAFGEWFNRWAKERRGFEDVYRLERRGYSDAMVELFQRHVMAAQAAALTGDIPEEVVNYRVEVDIVLSLMRVAEAAGLEGAAAGKAVTEFLYSDQAFDAPFNDINALLMAALARRAANGQKPPSGGMWNDITAISAYMPYSDALYVDDECCELLREGPLCDRIPNAVRIFSNKNREDFLQYLRLLEAEAGPAHTAKVIDVYGESWLKPYRAILADQREREARRRNRAPDESA